MTVSTEVVAALAGAGLGGFLGFLLSELKDWRARVRRRKAHWSALGAEIELCREIAESYLRDNVQAPLYRLPTLSYLNSFPVLLADGVPQEAEMRAITQFFSQVETLNRGLDQANEVRDREDRLNEETSRNRMKAEKLIASASYYSNVRSVLDQRLGKKQ
jgi:hypothetical protein